MMLKVEVFQPVLIPRASDVAALSDPLLCHVVRGTQEAMRSHGKGHVTQLAENMLQWYFNGFQVSGHCRNLWMKVQMLVGRKLLWSLVTGGLRGKQVCVKATNKQTNKNTEF